MKKFKRPDVLNGETITVKVGCGELLITFNYTEDERYKEYPLNEIFIKTKFKYKDEEEITAYCCDSFLQPLACLITWQIRRLEKEDRGSLLRQLIIKTDGGCPRKSVAVNKSCVDAIGRALLCYWEGHKFKDGICYVCKTLQKEATK